MSPAEPLTPSNGRAAILDAARRFAPHGVHLFFKHGAHFHDPLVPAQWEALAGEPALDDATVRRVVLEELSSRLPRQDITGAAPGGGCIPSGPGSTGAPHPGDVLPGLSRGIYSPVPMARGLEAGQSIEALLDEFRYEMIRVDSEQGWMWMGRPVALRIKTFFLENLGWEPSIARWFFEYQVNPEWWDKSYLEAEVTPLQALSVAEESGSLVASLNSGAKDALDLDTLRLDARERLFCNSARFGEVMFADALRFSVLRHANDTCDSVLVAGAWRPLHWPPR